MLLVVPTAGENVTHVSSDIKVQRKSLVLAKLGLSHIQFLSPEILLKKKKMATPAVGRRKEDFPTYSGLIRGTSQWAVLEGFSLRLLKSEVQSFACEISPRGKLHKRSQRFLY